MWNRLFVGEDNYGGGGEEDLVKIEKLKLGKNLPFFTHMISNVKLKSDNLKEGFDKNHYFKLGKNNKTLEIDLNKIVVRSIRNDHQVTSSDVLILGKAYLKLESFLKEEEEGKKNRGGRESSIMLEGEGEGGFKLKNEKQEIGQNGKLLEEKLEQIKNRIYTHSKSFLKEIFQTMKNEYNLELTQYKNVSNKSSKIKAFAIDCVHRNRPKRVLKPLFRLFNKDDLTYKHYFKLFLSEYKMCTFQQCINESSNYLPRSSKFIECCQIDFFYDLLIDEQQFIIIESFLKEFNKLNSLKDVDLLLRKYTTTTTTKLKEWDHLKALIEIEKSVGEDQWFLAVLKENFVGYIKEFLEKYDYVSIDEMRVNMKIKEIKSYINDVQSTNRDYEKRLKYFFIDRLLKQNWYDSCVVAVDDSVDNAENEDEMVKSSFCCDENDDEDEDDKAKVNELKELWLQDKLDSHKLDEYESYVSKEMKNSWLKAENCVYLSEIHSNKKPLIPTYIKNAIAHLTNAIRIYEYYIMKLEGGGGGAMNEKFSEKNLKLKNAYERRAILFLSLSKKENKKSFQKIEYLNKAKKDFLASNKLLLLINQQQNNNNNELDFIHFYKEGYLARENLSFQKSIYLYDKAIEINEYFFEAKFQKMLSYYECNELRERFYLMKDFESLSKSAQPVLDLFRAIITNSKNNNNNNVTMNVNEHLYDLVFRVHIKNNKSKRFYVKLVKIEDEEEAAAVVINNGQRGRRRQYELLLNSIENLFYLLKYGKESVTRLVYNDNNANTNSNTNNNRYYLKHKLTNTELKDYLNKLIASEKIQEEHLQTQIGLFKQLELTTNKNEYKKKLDRLVLKYMHTQSHQNLLDIYLSRNLYQQAIIEASHALSSYSSLLIRLESDAAAAAVAQKQQRVKKTSRQEEEGEGYSTRLEHKEIKNDIKLARKGYLNVYTVRANVYRKLKYYSCEEIDLKMILEIEKKSKRNNNNNDPIVNYRLAVINKEKGDLKLALKYANLANKSYFTKTNKQIYTKVRRLLDELNNHNNKNNQIIELSTVVDDIGTDSIKTANEGDFDYLNRHNINLLNIIDVVRKFYDCKRNDIDLLEQYGIEWFTVTDQDDNHSYYFSYQSLLICLFYHLIRHYDNNNGNFNIANHLVDSESLFAIKYNELKDELRRFKKENDDGERLTGDEEREIVDLFNKKFHTNVDILFLDDENLHERLNEYYDESIRIKKQRNWTPLVFTRVIGQVNKQTTYKTVKGLNYYKTLTLLLATNNPAGVIKKVIDNVLDDEICKSFHYTTATSSSGQGEGYNENLVKFIQSIMQCESVKRFAEEIIYSNYFIFNAAAATIAVGKLKLNEDDEENKKRKVFEFWSFISNIEASIDISDTLNNFKESCVSAIDDYKKKKEDEGKLELCKIDEMISDNEQKQNSLSAFIKFKEKMIQQFEKPHIMSPESLNRKNIENVLNSNLDISAKLRRLIADDCFDLQLDAEVESGAFSFIENEMETANKLLNIIEKALEASHLVVLNNVIKVTSYTIFLSSIIKSIEKNLADKDSGRHITEVHLYGVNIFIDCSISSLPFWHSISLVVVSQKNIEFVKSNNDDGGGGGLITIDLSGKDGADGKHAPNQPHSRVERENGLDGLPGGNGEAGENGGNIYLTANSSIRGKSNLLKLICNGGHGGCGGNGGNGGNGISGSNGYVNEEDPFDKRTGFFDCNSGVDTDVRYSRGTHGVPGKNKTRFVLLFLNILPRI